jgi:hypothetical protein
MSKFSKVSCHIIGFNPYSKIEFISQLDKKIFNIIDLDNINQEILADSIMDKFYRQYQKLKSEKNDKFKDVDKKMSQHWESKFIENVESKIVGKKINILIGQNNHYKSIYKRVNIECTNKFIVGSDIEQEIKAWIQYNLDTYRNDIIQGTFPLEYINTDFLYKKRILISTLYKKIGYIEKTITQLKSIMKLIVQQISDNETIWVGLKEPYNIGSLIHPISNGKIVGYNDPFIALLGSFNLANTDVKPKFTGSEITLEEIKPLGLKKLHARRYLYMVESNNFIPHENGYGQKYFSQHPVKILSKERIDNVFAYLTQTKKTEN